MINSRLSHAQQNGKKHWPRFTPTYFFSHLTQVSTSELVTLATHQGHCHWSLQAALPHTKQLPDSRDVALPDIPSTMILL